MRIGYACLAVGVPDTGFRSCTMKNADEERLTAIISHNLHSLEKIMEYNHKNGIRMFRISSDLIPFGSSPVNFLEWWNIFGDEFKRIGDMVKKYDIRVSMHPGQYTVLNSPDANIVERAVLDLQYHTRILDCMGVDKTCKIILHVGGVYGDKAQAARRFELNWRGMKDSVKERLVIENDDRNYTVEDVLEISGRVGVPVVFDNLHHALNPSIEKNPDFFWVAECGKTWKRMDGNPKIHYSQQNGNKKKGSHSDIIRIREFMEYLDGLGNEGPDIMLEVKDKNLSAVKCINCVTPGKTARKLELEWSRYKYKVLENSQEKYNQIRKMLKDKECSPVSFYSVLEEALDMQGNAGSFINAAQHVWGYFKDHADEMEREKFKKAMVSFQRGDLPLSAIKKYMWKLSVKYQEEYLLNSYYFIL
ncbi:UV DNA damage repair endonuclease UvsE [Parasporobacterium paucivorans]|uniref:UV-damage endonuclease n=1 Tax=Parasporobacterium paucivorans DSM 15970 TaxID=1122934 RepID=A0A1M6H074_9FIRM|nr:UV DNA damage repair endonuclease UvsE [Parasporobacterium paucivorans]SHJ15560.1 UV-damage endonuclease [Parasporobacterium paucivorans DSM 15970]